MKIWKSIKFALWGYWQIPKVDYCYSLPKGSENATGGYTPRRICCPYWDKLEGHQYQEDGYCHWMDCGDYFQDENGVPNGTMLLWDQVKECGLNKYSEKEEKKMYEKCMKEREE